MLPVAPRLMGSMTTLYSHSRLSAFETCPQKFAFRYVEQIRAETEGIEAFVGKRVHEVLERLYEFVAREQVPSLRRVLERYHALFDEHYDAARVLIVREGLGVEHYRALGVRCLENHYREHYPFDGDETLAVEERVVFRLDAQGRFGIQGFVDRIARASDGAIEIHDYKTGENVPSQKKLDVDRQLALYQLGLAERFDAGRPIRLVWQFLSRGLRRVSTRSPEQLEALRRESLALIERIESATEYPARKSNLCRWCDYQAICPAWGGAGAPERAARAEPEPVPPARDAQPRLFG
jgi:putative RecB family exonuclease